MTLRCGMAGWITLRVALIAAVSGWAVVAGQGSAVAADPGTTVTGTVGSGLSKHSYRVYIPSTYRPNRPAPLVVMTHGCQTTAEQQQRANQYDVVAERERFLVLYPDVNPIEAKLQPGPLENCWQFPLPTSWLRGLGDPAAIAAMTQTVMSGWRVDPERVYMVGMSAGGFMTSIMAAAYPDLFAAVAINAGGAYADGTCIGVPAGLPVALTARLARWQMGGRARVVPRLAMGGDADRGIPPGCVDKALEQGLRTNNLALGGSQTGPISLKPASTRGVDGAEPNDYDSTVTTYLDPDGCVVGERWLIHGMDHFWPGGSTDPELASFTDPKGPDGAEITWAFLSRFTRSGTAPPCAEAMRH